MSRLDLAAIKARVEAATEGPWVRVNNGSPFEFRSMVAVRACDASETVCAISHWNDETDHDDAEFVAHARTDIPALVARVEELEAALGGYATMLDECEARLIGLIEAYSDETSALREYFGVHGADHSDENCPQDDTCECPEHMPLKAAWQRFGREIELAHRRLDRIREARSALSGEEPK